MATTQIKDGFNGGSDNQMKVNADGSINVDVSGSGGTTNVNLTEVAGSAIALGQTTMSASLPVTIASNQTAIPVTQSGTWTTGRTWDLSSTTDSVSAVQSGSWTVAATQSGSWTVAATQSGTWTTGRTWDLSSTTDSIAAVQSGSWTVTANAGSGNFTVVQPTGSNLHVDVDNFPSIQPVSGTVNTNLNGLSSWSTQQVTVGTSATQIDATQLTGRSNIQVKGLSTNTVAIFIGPTNAVTTSTGFPIFAGDTVTLDMQTTDQIWGISASAGQVIAIMQAG